MLRSVFAWILETFWAIDGRFVPILIICQYIRYPSDTNLLHFINKTSKWKTISRIIILSSFSIFFPELYLACYSLWSFRFCCIFNELNVCQECLYRPTNCFNTQYSLSIFWTGLFYEFYPPWRLVIAKRYCGEV